MTLLPGTAWPSAPADGAAFVPTPVHGPALTTLEGALAGAPGLALVTGAPGTGKTTLCRTLHASLAADPRHAAGLVADAGALRGDLRLLRGLVAALGQTATGRNGLTMLAELRAGVAALAASGRTATLLVDNAQALGGSQLETLRSLLGDAAAPAGEAARPAVVLFATPELSDRIARRQGLAGHVTAVVALPALDRAGLAALLAGHARFEGAGGPHLSAGALDALLVASGGIAGRALPLAAAARAEALALGWEQVDERLVAHAAARAARGLGTATGAPLQDAAALQASLPLGVDDAAPGLSPPTSAAQLPLLGGEEGGA